MRDQRWYDVDGATVLIYNAPRPENATAVSIVKTEDLKYYKNNFALSKIWKKEM